MATTPFNIPICKWTLVVDGEKQGRIRLITTNPAQYFYIVLPSGSTEPGVEDAGTRLDVEDWEFNYRDDVDIYFLTKQYDGKVILDDDAPYIDTFSQDQTTPPIEYFLSRLLNPVVVLNPQLAKDNTLVLQAGHGVVPGNYIEIYNEKIIPGFGVLKRFAQLYVASVVGDTIRTGRFIGFDIDPSTIIFSDRMSINLNVLGTIDAPVRFRAGPPNGIEWDLVRTILAMVLTTNPDDALFGNLPQLTYGIFFGFEGDQAEDYLVDIRANAGFRGTAYDVSYTTRSSGGGSYGLSMRKSFASKNSYGVAIRLEGPTNDEFVLYVQDDLTLLTEFGIKVMGHIVD